MIQLEVFCALQDDTEFRDAATFALDVDVDGPEGHCVVQVGQAFSSVSVLADSGWPFQVHLLLARALARASRSDLASSLTVSAVVRVAVHVNLCGIPYDVLLARGDGRQVCDSYGPFVEGAAKRFQAWRLVRQMLERRTVKPYRAQTELGIYRAGPIEYCRVSELPEDLQLAFGICHALSPRPCTPGVADACYLEDMQLFLEMVRLGRGYPSLVLSRHSYGS